MSYLYKFFLGKKYADGTIDYLGEKPIIISRYSEYVLSEDFLRPFDYVSKKTDDTFLKFISFLHQPFYFLFAGKTKTEGGS